MTDPLLMFALAIPSLVALGEDSLVWGILSALGVGILAAGRAVWKLVTGVAGKLFGGPGEEGAVERFLGKFDGLRGDLRENTTEVQGMREDVRENTATLAKLIDRHNSEVTQIPAERRKRG